MRKNEIKKTIEQVVGVEYIAEDGTVFCNEEECAKYEKSALFTVSKRLKKLTTKFISIYDLIGGGLEDNELEIFDIQTEEDLENLRKYLYLKAKANGASENSIKSCFTSIDGVKRKNFVCDNITAGHEVLIFWSYDKDWFWTYQDGSLEGYFNFVRDNFTKITTPDETNKTEA